jgi:hypothetical protein
MELSQDLFFSLNIVSLSVFTLYLKALICENLRVIKFCFDLV